MRLLLLNDIRKRITEAVRLLSGCSHRSSLTVQTYVNKKQQICNVTLCKDRSHLLVQFLGQLTVCY